MNTCRSCRHFQPAPKVGPGGFCYRLPPYNHQRFVSQMVDGNQTTVPLWVPSRAWVDLVERACGEFRGPSWWRRIKAWF